MRIVLWISLLLAADALFGLLSADRLARKMPGLPVERWAMIEGALALILGLVYLMVRLYA
jgi:hypothetical protein